MTSKLVIPTDSIHDHRKATVKRMSVQRCDAPATAGAFLPQGACFLLPNRTKTRLDDCTIIAPSFDTCERSCAERVFGPALRIPPAFPGPTLMNCPSNTSGAQNHDVWQDTNSLV